MIVGIGPEDELLVLRVDLDAGAAGVFELAEGEMAKDEEAAFSAFGGDAPLQRGLPARNARRDGDGPLSQSIEPAAVAKAHFERRRHGEPPPSVGPNDEDSEAVPAHDVVGVARNGKELVKRRVADVSWAAKTPCIQAVAHKVSSVGSISAPLRSIAPWRRAIERSLSRNTTWRLWPPAGVKNDSVSPPRRLDMRAAAIARADRPIVQPIGDGDRRFMDERARRRGEDDLALPPACGDPFDLIDEREVGVGRGSGMIGLIGAEEGPARRRSRREGHGLRLKRRAAGLVLQALRGEGRAERQARFRRRRGRRGPSARADRWRSRLRPRDSRARPRDARRLERDFVGSSRPTRRADGARRR